MAVSDFLQRAAANDRARVSWPFGVPRVAVAISTQLGFGPALVDNGTSYGVPLDALSKRILIFAKGVS